MKDIKILCTLGPASINKKFLKFASNKISILRLNMSHIEVRNLATLIKFVKKNTKTPICLDTEGAQIRTKVKKKKYFKINQIISVKEFDGNFNLYPETVFKQLKKGNILDIGFDNLRAKVIQKGNHKIVLKVLKAGKLENNKGVHLINKKIKLSCLTKKDIQAIEIAKKYKINYYALSFTNTIKDIKKFKKILPNKQRIYKIETSVALKNLDKFFKMEKNFLIDRGDLSKDIGLENVPIAQREIFKKKKKFKKVNVFVATNFLESMVENAQPSRAEINDIYNSLEIGSNGLVLASETAIGKYPESCVKFIKKIIKVFKKQKLYNF